MKLSLLPTRWPRLPKRIHRRLALQATLKRLSNGLSRGARAALGHLLAFGEQVRSLPLPALHPPDFARGISRTREFLRRLACAAARAQEAASEAFLLAGACACLLRQKFRLPQFKGRSPIKFLFARLGRTFRVGIQAILIGLLLASRAGLLRTLKAYPKPLAGAKQFLGRLRLGDKAIFWGLFLLAAIPRLVGLETILFGPEGAYALSQAEALLHSFPWAPATLPSRAPLLVVLLMAPIALDRDPRTAAAFLLLLNVGAMALLVWTVRRHWGRRRAVLAGLFSATLPWPVWAARSLAPDSLLLTLATLMFAVLIAGIEGRNPWAWAAAPLTAGIAFLVSPWGLMLPIILVSTLLFYWRRVRWGHFALGCLCLGLTMGVYLYSLDVEGQLKNLWALPPITKTSLEEGISPFMALFGEEYGLLRGIGEAIYGLWGASLILAVWGAFYAWSHWEVGLPLGHYILSAIWNLVILAIVAFAPTLLTPQSLSALLLPGAVLGIVLVLDWVAFLPRLRRSLLRPAFAWLGALPWVIGLLLALWGLYTLGLIDMASRQGRFLGGEKPYYAWRQAQEAISSEASAAQSDQVWLIESATSAPWLAETQPLKYLLQGEIDVVTLHQTPGSVLLPAERPGIYVFSQDPPWVERLLSYLGGSSAKTIWVGDAPFYLHILAKRPAEEMLTLVPNRTLGSFDAGLHFVGYAWPQPYAGETAAIATYWTFWDIPSYEQNFSHRFTITLVDTQGNAFAQSEGFGLEERDWQEGLLIEQWHLLNLKNVPPGAYILILRLERRGESPCLYVDEAGTPIGSGIALGPVIVLPRQ